MWMVGSQNLPGFQNVRNYWNVGWTKVHTLPIMGVDPIDTTKPDLEKEGLIIEASMGALESHQTSAFLNSKMKEIFKLRYIHIPLKDLMLKD